MRKLKIGVTERGDAGLDLSWRGKMDQVDGAVLITKELTDDFVEAVLPYRGKVIVHIGCTGFGGSVLEPNVPPASFQLEQAVKLLLRGFFVEQVVIRVDPIIPTQKGLETAAEVITDFLHEGFHRFRVSVLDAYPHVRQRFENASLPLPYGNGFSASDRQFESVDRMLAEIQRRFQYVGGLRIESCAEPKLTIPIRCGCVSAYDLELLNLSPKDCDSAGFQRAECMCYSGKTELLANRTRCPHQCLYCFWKD